MFGLRRLRYREHDRLADEKAQRDLARRRKIAVAKRRVGDHRDTMPLAPWNHRMLDGPLIEVIEHLVAGNLAFTGNVENLVEIVGVEIADAPGADFSRALELLERSDRVGKRIAVTPLQEIAIEAIDLEPPQRALAGRNRAASRCVAGQQL